jgi:hypothetical protein
MEQVIIPIYYRRIQSLESSELINDLNQSKTKILKSVSITFCLNIPYNKFNFHVFNGKTYKLLNRDDVLPKELVSYFFKENHKEKMQQLIENDILLMLSFELPRKGLNIIVKFGVEESREILEKYGIIGNKMELIWKDGKFTVGKVYWSE